MGVWRQALINFKSFDDNIKKQGNMTFMFPCFLIKKMDAL